MVRSRKRRRYPHRATSRNSRQLDRAMTVARQQSRELIALEGGASPATSAAASPSLPIPASPATWLRNRPSQQQDRNSYTVTALADITDRALHAATARFTAGLSPAALAEAYLDWATHLAYAPGKRMQLVDKAMRKAMRFGNYAATAAPCRAARRRPASSRCRRTGASPTRRGSTGRSTSSTRLSCCSSNGGTTPRPACAASRSSTRTWSSSPSRQLLDMFSPSNFLAHQSRGPRAHGRARAGMNLVAACRTSWRTGERAVGGKKPVGTEAFEVGRDVAVTPGQGRLPQPADRADPVRADDRHGPAGADPDRAGLDHEVLHPRPVAAELAGQLPDRAGLHGLHDLLEEPRAGGPRPRHGRLPHARRDGRARCRQCDRARAEGPRRRLLPRRHAAVDRRGRHGARRRRAARIDHAASPRRPTSPRPAS